MAANASPVLDRLVAPLSQCLTPESARRVLKLTADRQLQARVALLADKCSADTLTRDERAEYENYVQFGSFIAVLKSKARLLLATADES